MSEPRFTPSSTLYQYGDPHLKQAALDKWKPILDNLGLEIFTHASVPREPVRMMLDNTMWEMELIEDFTKPYTIPDEVYAKRLQAIEMGVPFAWWIWCDEKFSHPNFQRASGSNFTSSSPSQIVAPTTTNAETYYEIIERRRDPALFGVIPTDLKKMTGWWVLMGQWAH